MRYLFLFLIFPCIAIAEENNLSHYDFVVPLRPELSDSGNSVTLSWKTSDSTESFTLFRKIYGENDFSPLRIFGSEVISYTDTITPGIHYEYVLEQKRTDIENTYGYLSVGTELELPANRGRALVLIDKTIISEIYDEIYFFISGLKGDGWEPLIDTVPRAETFDTKKVEFVKEKIREYYNEPESISALILIGRVPVPYSGIYAIDGHNPDHYGAWPADAYYAEMDLQWPDNDTTTVATEDRHKNFRGDGKYDLHYLESGLEFPVGRIDFFDLPAFFESETELIKQYLKRNYRYKLGLDTAPDSAIAYSWFEPGSYREEFVANALQNYYALFPKENFYIGRLREEPRIKDFLFAYGASSGSYTSIHDGLYSDELAVNHHNAVFTGLLGSYVADWDSRNNLLRSVIASRPKALAAFFMGRPYLFLHPMSKGATLGECFLLSQNLSHTQYPAYSPFYRRMQHLAIMGDPTLRLKYPSHAALVSCGSSESKTIQINWKETGLAVDGYYIFKKNTAGSWEKINETLVKITNFTDDNPRFGINEYMVKAVNMEYSPGGFYYNTGIGEICTCEFPGSQTIGDDDYFKAIGVAVAPNPSLGKVKFGIYRIFEENFPDGGNVFVEIYDVHGNLVNEIEIENGGNYTEFEWDFRNSEGNTVSSGQYYTRVRDAQGSTDVILVKLN
jgi:hypothetical protein